MAGRDGYMVNINYIFFYLFRIIINYVSMLMEDYVFYANEITLAL